MTMEYLYSTLIAFVIVHFYSSSVNSKEFNEEYYCLATDPNPYLRFSSKTAYEFVYGKEEYEPVSFCTPRQVWVLVRHGTRYPSAKEIKKFKSLEKTRDEIVKNHEERHNGTLCTEDLDNLKAWQYDLTVDENYNLTQTGWNEHKNFAQRLKSKFSELLDAPYSSENYTITTTDSTRTWLSAKAFTEGMFGPDSDVQIPPANETIIKVYRHCPVWSKEVDDNPDAIKEYELFVKSDLMKEVIFSVSQRLGFAYNLTYDDLYRMFSMCGYEKAWEYNKTSAWCAAFTKDELKVIEYAQDIFYYYTTGYGNDLNLKVGCPVVRDMMERFMRLANNDTKEPNGVFYFSHTHSVNTALSRFGFAKDPYAIKHDNYFNATDRKWQSSLIGPFMSNIQAVFYKCSQGEENRVQFFMNEHLIHYEGCQNGVCSWKYLNEKLGPVVDPTKCNSDFCQKSAANLLSYNLLLSISIVCIVTNVNVKYFL